MEEKLAHLLLRAESDDPVGQPEIDRCYLASVEDILAKIAYAREAEDASLYSSLEIQLERARTDMVESTQAATRKPMWDVIIKLRQGGDLDPADMKLIRLWMVGDADAYLEEENNFGDWQEELERLTREIEGCRSVPPDVDSLEVLCALLKDARGVARDIASFISERERVQRFEQSTQGELDDVARGALADVLARAYNAQLP
jgi:hypothetical protein